MPDSAARLQNPYRTPAASRRRCTRFRECCSASTQYPQSRRPAFLQAAEMPLSGMTDFCSAFVCPRPQRGHTARRTPQAGHHRRLLHRRQDICTPAPRQDTLPPPRNHAPPYTKKETQARKPHPRRRQQPQPRVPASDISPTRHAERNRPT